MTICNYFTHDDMSDLTAALQRMADAGIDPAFDAECEELERQFAELRFSSNRN